MSNRIAAALAEKLRGHVPLGKSRLETLCLLVVGMIGARTVNLAHVATERGGPVQPASTYRRLQRFFEQVTLGQDWAVALLAAMIGAPQWVLVLDRTNWTIGRREVNFLVLAAVTPRFRVPLFWTLLPHGGNSSTEDRKALIRRYLAHFPLDSIRYLLADREFVGAEWLKFLNDLNILFATRLRENLRVTDEAGHELTLYARLRRAGRTRFFYARMGTREEADASGAPLLGFAARRLKDEWLIVVTNLPPRKALNAYRKRWAIECLFSHAKTRGLNLEDTGLACPRRLSILMSAVALATAWALREATSRQGIRPPARKNHGHLARSWFRSGFDNLRHLIRSASDEALKPWEKLPKPQTTPRVV